MLLTSTATSWETSVKELTTRQRVVLRTLQGFIAREGIAPTFQELGDELGMTAASVRQHVLAIERKGFLRRHPGKSRGLVLLPAKDKRGGRGK